MKKRPRIIVAPLDWGLGHATRCIPVIRELITQDAEVIIAADGRAAKLLREEFSQLQHIYLKGYNVHYSSSLPMSLAIALQVPKIIFTITREHFQLKKLIKQYKPDVIISDNRYGLWSKNLTPALSKGECEKKRRVHTVFITHQLMVKTPKLFSFLEPILHRIVLFFVKRYNECWVPDVEGRENISGDLSHKYPLPANAKYIGWLSRFNPGKVHSGIPIKSGAPAKKYDLLILLSGTEPLRTELEKRLTEQVKKTTYRSLMVRGVTDEQKQFSNDNNLSVVPYLGSEELLATMQESDTIICRSGYSSLMDLAATGKKAVLIPTPGQTEQEYMALELLKKKKYFSSSQEKFNLDEALKASANFNAQTGLMFETALSKTVESLLKKIKDDV